MACGDELQRSLGGRHGAQGCGVLLHEDGACQVAVDEVGASAHEGRVGVELRLQSQDAQVEAEAVIDAHALGVEGRETVVHGHQRHV